MFPLGFILKLYQEFALDDLMVELMLQMILVSIIFRTNCVQDIDQ